MPFFSRRKFFTATALLSFSGLAKSAPIKEKKKLIVHHELFWLRKPLTDNDKLKFVNGLKALIEIENHHTFIGEPMSKSGNNREVEDGYDFSLLTYFDDVQGYHRYKNHQVYQKLVSEFSSYWEKVAEFNSLTL